MFKLDNVVRESNEYSRFIVPKGQPVDRASKRYKELKASIRGYGTNITPIIVTRSGIVVDGNTRVAACGDEGKPVTYLVRDISLDVIAELNNTSTAWTTLNYINSKAQSGVFPKYEKFLEFLSKNKEYTLGVVLTMVGHTPKQVINGNLNVDYVELATRLSIYNRVLATLGTYSATKAQVATALKGEVFNRGICSDEFLMKLRLRNPTAKIESRKLIAEYFREVLIREVA